MQGTKDIRAVLTQLSANDERRVYGDLDRTEPEILPLSSKEGKIPIIQGTQSDQLGHEQALCRSDESFDWLTTRSKQSYS